MHTVLSNIVASLARRLGYQLISTESIEAARVLEVGLRRAIAESGHLSWRYNVRATLDDALTSLHAALRAPDFHAKGR